MKTLFRMKFFFLGEGKAMFRLIDGKSSQKTCPETEISSQTKIVELLLFLLVKPQEVDAHRESVPHLP